MEMMCSLNWIFVCVIYEILVGGGGFKLLERVPQDWGFFAFFGGGMFSSFID